MSSETPHIPSDIARLKKNALFQGGISLDGRIPITNFLLHEQAPLLVGNTVVYDVNRRQHLSTRFDQVLYEVPLQFDTPVRTGCIQAKETIDTQTGKIVKFSLGIRPQFDDVKTNELLYLFEMLKESEDIDVEPEEMYERHVPTCYIDSEEGISLYDSSGLILGYGPGFGEEGLNLSDTFTSLMQDQKASIRREDGSFREAKYSLLERTIERPDDSGRDILMRYTVESGFRVTMNSFQQTKRACRSLLEKGVNVDNTIYRIVEPFLNVTVKNGGDAAFD